jgi:hypothetical protein
MKRIRERVRELTDARHGGQDVKQIIAKLNPGFRVIEDAWGRLLHTVATARGAASRRSVQCDVLRGAQRL